MSVYHHKERQLLVARMVVAYHTIQNESAIHTMVL